MPDLIKDDHQSPPAEVSSLIRLQAETLPSLEQRTQLVQKLDQSLQAQKFYGDGDFASVGILATGLVAMQAYKPLGVGLIGAGVVAGLYSNYRYDQAHGQGNDALGKMPKIDVTRFRPYQEAMQASHEHTGYGYMAAGATTLLSRTPILRGVPENTLAGLGVAAVANDGYNTVSVRPKIVGDFHADVDKWKKEVKKNDFLRFDLQVGS